MLWGDILLVGCCAFYLLWWIVAFKPVNAVKGAKSGWLLIPALFLGVAALIMIVWGMNKAVTSDSFFSTGTVLLAGVIAYVVLLVVTRLAFHRMVTTELFLIVGWTVLTFLEVNALYGMDRVARNGAVGLLATAVIVAAVSMVCYMLYYGLNERVGYVDGMIPLLLIAGFMAVLAVLIARAGK